MDTAEQVLEAHGFGGERLLKLSRKIANDKLRRRGAFLDHERLVETVPEKSWKRVRAAWGDFFKWSIREGKRPDNPVEWLPKLRPTPEPVYDLWKQEELDLLVAGTRKMESPLRERLRVLTMIESGARAGELRGLQLGDFDLYRKTITVLGKGQERRLSPISAELAGTVDEYLLTT